MTSSDTRRATPAFADGRNLPWLLSTWAQRRPDHPYLVWEPFTGERRVWTYAQFWTDVRRVVAGLPARGIKPGDRVLLHTDNCPEFVLSWWALTALGAVAVCTNTKSSLDEMTYFASHSEAVAAITQPKFADLLGKAMPNASWLALTETDSGDEPVSRPTTHDSFERLLHDDTDGAPHLSLPSTHASIQYTSGTTSRPKAVVWTHANGLWGSRVSASHAGLDASTVTLLHLPLFHTNAMCYSMFSTTWVGGTIVLMPRFSRTRFWDTAIRNDATYSGVIGFCIKALQSHPVPEKHSIRLFGNGSSVPATEQRYGIACMGWYGMTETVSHPIAGEPFLPNRPGSCGRAVPEYDVAILDEETGAPVQPGETGSLFVRGVRGVSLFEEYLHDPTATANAFNDRGWLITGDRVTLHDDGFITFADRGKDMLKVGAENVAASEIERVILTVAGVSEVAVVAAKHPMLDEVPVAFVIPGEGTDRATLAATIDAACRDQLATFKIPTEIRLVDELPRSTLNKVAKAELRKVLAEPTP